MSKKALSKEYIQWAVWAYDDGFLKWKHMDDATMDAVDHELRKRKQKIKAHRYEAQRKEDQRFEAWRKEALEKLDKMRTCMDASSYEQTIVVAPSQQPVIDASKTKPATLDISDSKLKQGEADYPHDTLVSPQPLQPTSRLTTECRCLVYAAPKVTGYYADDPLRRLGNNAGSMKIIHVPPYKSSTQPPPLAASSTPSQLGNFLSTVLHPK